MTSTAGTHLSKRTYVPLFLQTVKIYIFQSHQSPSGPVYTRKTLQVFRNYRDWFEHENTFQNYQTKKATHTRALISCCAVALAQHLGRNCLFPQHSPKAMCGLPQHGFWGRNIPAPQAPLRYCCGVNFAEGEKKNWGPFFRPRRMYQVCVKKKWGAVFFV